MHVFKWDCVLSKLLSWVRFPSVFVVGLLRNLVFSISKLCLFFSLSWEHGLVWLTSLMMINNVCFILIFFLFSFAYSLLGRCIPWYFGFQTSFS